MWFGYDADWVMKADTEGTGRSVSLNIYRYRVRGCLKKAYFFSLVVWGLEFTYLNNGSNTKNILIFQPGELETFPNIRIHQSVFLGSTKLSYLDFLSIVESLSSNNSNNTVTSIVRNRATQPTSSSISRYISRSSSIGHDLNVTLSQSYSPTNLSKCDCSVPVYLNQRMFITSLSFRLLNTNNTVSIIKRLVTNASPSNFYLNKKMLVDMPLSNGLIIYIGDDNYRLVDISVANFILSSKLNAAQYFHLLLEDSSDQLLLRIEQQLQGLNKQPVSHPTDQVDQKEDRVSSAHKLDVNEINEGVYTKTNIDASASADIDADVILNPRISVESDHSSPDHVTEAKPIIGPTVQTPRTKRQCLHKTNQQATASPRQKILKRGNQPSSPPPPPVPPPTLVPAPVCAPDPSMDVAAPLSLMEIPITQPRSDHLIVQNFNPFPVGQLSERKHLRTMSADVVGDTSKELSEDSCLDELINVQPFMKSERIDSIQSTSLAENSEESIDIIVDNIGMVSRNYRPTIKTQAETATILWGQTTARSVVHGGSV